MERTYATRTTGERGFELWLFSEGFCRDSDVDDDLATIVLEVVCKCENGNDATGKRELGKVWKQF